MSMYNRKRLDTVHNKKWLEQKYLIEHKSAIEIATELACNKSIIHKALKRFNIKLRGSITRYKLLADKTWLIHRYENEKLSLYAIAKLVRGTAGNVRCYLLSYGVKLRNKEEVSRINKSYKGGVISRKNGKRRYIKKPDHPMALDNGYITETRFILEYYYDKQLEEIGCQYQNCSTDFVLEIHHRDSDAYNNDPKNLVILCPTHHKAIERKVLKENYDIRKMVPQEQT